MTFEKLKEAVYDEAALPLEDLDSSEKNVLDRKILAAANMGADTLAREVYPLRRAVTVTGTAEWEAPEEYISLESCRGGKFHIEYSENGGEKLVLEKEKDYKIVYRRTHSVVTGDEDTLEFPRQVLAALKYYICMSLLSPANDKRAYAYYKNLYDQQCANIQSSLPRRATVRGGGIGV